MGTTSLVQAPAIIERLFVSVCADFVPEDKVRSLRTFFPTIALTAAEAGQYAARARSGKPSGSPDLAFKDTYSAA